MNNTTVKDINLAEPKISGLKEAGDQEMKNAAMDNRNQVLAISFLFVGMYVVGALFPDTFWGTHYPAFLPGLLSGGILTAAALLILLSAYPSLKITCPLRLSLLVDKYPTGFCLAISALMGVLFYAFPIYLDDYGDAKFLPADLNYFVRKWDWRIIRNLVRNNLTSTKVGTDTMFSLVNMVAFFTRTTASKALLILNAGCGILFVFLWMKMVNALVPEKPWKWLAWLMGLAAPFMQTFFGHYEVYAPAVLATLAYFMVMALYMKTEKRAYLWTTAALFLLNIKLHITAYLLLPSLIFILAYSMCARWPAIRPAFTWKNLTRWLLLPLTVLGILIYVFVAGSHDGPRGFTTGSLERAVFLPLYTNEGPPLDRYNLFGLNHMVDYLNLIFLWSSVGLFLLAVFLIFYRKAIRWNQPALLVTGMSLIIYTGAFFVLNPLLSMPIDWDLFSLPAPILLAFVVLILSQLKDKAPAPTVVGTCIALTLLSASTFMVNAGQHSLSNRLESVGIREFKTYWIGSSTSIHAAMSLAPNPEAAQRRRIALLQKLEPHAVQGNDLEYGDLLCEAGKYHFEVDKDYRKALTFFERAYTYSPNLSRNVYYLVIANFMLERFNAAHSYSWLLTRVWHPTREKAYRIAIHVALEAEAYADAQTFCEEYLTIWPGEPFIAKVHNALKGGKDPERAKEFFKGD